MMKKQSATVYLSQAAQEWGRCLGDAVTAIVGYGSVYESHFVVGESDLNVLVLLADGCDLSAVRAKSVALWDEHKVHLKRPPRLVCESVWAKHLRLNPVFLEHFRKVGRILYGSIQQLDIPRPIVGSRKLYRWHEAFLCSRALLEEEGRADLNRLWRQVMATPAATETTPLDELGALWLAFDFPLPQNVQFAPQEAAPYGIQELVALYSSLDILVIIVASVEALLATDWVAVGEQIAEQGDISLRVATPVQFYSILSGYGALDVQLLTYDYVWGVDIVAQIKPKVTKSCYAAARFASDLQVNYFADHYFSKPPSPEHSYHHIHELQNKLLNVRLQNEILTRLDLMDPFLTEGGALPGREVTDGVRFRAIYDRLDEWIDYYLEVARQED